MKLLVPLPSPVENTTIALFNLSTYGDFFGRRNKMTSTFVESDFICYAVLLHSVPGERRIKVYSNQIFFIS